MPRRIIRGLQLLVALLVVAAGSLAAAPSAQPKVTVYLKDFQTTVETSPSNSQAIKENEFDCPGKSEIGAGISVSPPLSNLGISSLGEGGGEIDSRAQETDSEPAAWAMTLRAWCAVGTATKPNTGGAVSYIKRVVVERNRSSSNSNAFKSVEATCPSNSATAIGGGGTIDGATNQVTLESVQRLRQGRALRVKAHETDATGASWAVEAHAICADTASAPTANVYVEAVETPVPTSATSSLNKTLTASCPAGKVVVGGGANAFTPLNPGGVGHLDVVLEQSRPAGGGPTARGWIASAVEVDPAAGSWTLVVRAVCAKPDGTFA